MPKISVAKLLWQSFRPKIPPSERRSPQKCGSLKSAADSKALQRHSADMLSDCRAPRLGLFLGFIPFLQHPPGLAQHIPDRIKQLFSAAAGFCRSQVKQFRHLVQPDNVKIMQ